MKVVNVNRGDSLQHAVQYVDVCSNKIKQGKIICVAQNYLSYCTLRLELTYLNKTMDIVHSLDSQGAIKLIEEDVK